VKSVKRKSSSTYRRRRSNNKQEKGIILGVSTLTLLLVILLVYNSLRKPGTDEPGPRAYEALFGVQGSSYDAGETGYVYPDPGNFGAGQKWLPALGSDDAPVTMIEFSDLACGYCRTFNLKNMETIANDYIASGKVRYVDHFYGSPSTIQAGALDALFCAAEQGHYFEFKHTLFQAIETNTFDISRAARVTGLIMRDFNDCVESGRYKAAIQEMVYEDNMDVNVTPTFFINGEKVVGNVPEEIRQKIDEALAN
jgi:hypothetical protein